MVILLLKLKKIHIPVTADKYAIRQPLNEGHNYINFLLNFTDDYNFLFVINNERNDRYSIFNREIINHIDGTVDLRSYYQLTMLCFVDRFGRKNVLEFSMYLFRFIYSLRLSDQSRIYESTVRNFINETLILERILNAFTYEEVIDYLKSYNVKISSQGIPGVKQRFFNRINSFFNTSIKFNNSIKIETYDQDLLNTINEYLKN